MKKVNIKVVEDKAIYLNDYRVCGRKVFVSENLKHYFFYVEVEEILNNIDREDIEEFLIKTK